jgi:hypothetical protein
MVGRGFYNKTWMFSTSISEMLVVSFRLGPVSTTFFLVGHYPEPTGEMQRHFSPVVLQSRILLKK